MMLSLRRQHSNEGWHAYWMCNVSVWGGALLQALLFVSGLHRLLCSTSPSNKELTPTQPEEELGKKPIPF